MEFKLNEYHQGVSDEEILEDIKNVSSEYNNQYLSISAYKAKGKYSESTIRNHFGSWSNVQIKLGLRTSRNSVEMKRISDDELVKDLLRVAEVVGSRKVTSTQYYQIGKYSSPTIIERFGAWSNFVEKAGLEQTDFIKPISTEELFEELERVWIVLSKQPTTNDMKKGIAKYSLDTYMRRFGGWRNALLAFIEYVNTEDADNDEAATEISIDSENQKEEIEKAPIKKYHKRTTRSINLKLRFRVLQRDNFKCCFCGASPAKDPSIELHVDHIVPWSKGGETILENMQTLCSKCNLGKSNLE